MRPHILLPLTCGFVISACGGDGAAGPGVASCEIVIEGRAERGSELQASLSPRHGAQCLPPEPPAWSVLPSGSAEVRPGGIIRLLEAGQLTLAVRVGEHTISRLVPVATPPRIVFEGTQDGNTDLYAAALDGRDLQRLTTHPLADLQPSTAPGRIVFTSYATGAGDLYMINGTAAPVQLTKTALTESDPAASPDGARIAYSAVTGGVAKLQLLSLPGGASVRITTGHSPTALETGASWAPDGEHIAFTSTHAGAADLYITRAAAAQSATPLLHTAAPEVEPAWNPTGTHVACAAVIAGDTEILLLEVASGTTARLTDRPGIDAQPAWLPDGRIVFTAYVNDRPTLRWLDPAVPGVTHEIPLPFAAANAAPVL